MTWASLEPLDHGMSLRSVIQFVQVQMWRSGRTSPEWVVELDNQVDRWMQSLIDSIHTDARPFTDAPMRGLAVLLLRGEQLEPELQECLSILRSNWQSTAEDNKGDDEK